MTRACLTFLSAAALLGGPALAQSPAPPVTVTPVTVTPVTVTVDAAHPGPALPGGFSGLSFEMEKVLPGADGRSFFRPDNAPLVRLFKTLGLKSLRLGGNTADRPALPTPAPADLDRLLAFARAAGVKVIYTLRLRQGDPAADAATAKYVVDHGRDALDAFALGNEPSGYTPGYAAYHDAWLTYTGAVTAPGVAPDAKFCGPGATGGTASWTRSLAADFGHSGPLAFVTQHYYPFGAGTKVTDPAAGRDTLLAAGVAAQYERFYAGFGPAALAAGVPYRLEESNNFYYGGAKGVSDTLAAALWGLDSLYWWASHGALGVNFHTGDQVARGDTNTPCWYSPFWTSAGGYAAHPLAYGLKAFDLGGHGRLVPVTITPGGGDLTAYATQGADGGLSVTLINKDHGAGAHAAAVTVAFGTGAGKYRRGQVMFLAAPGGDPAAKAGVTLGGAAIAEDGRWAGVWSPLALSGDRVRVTVPATAAAVVRLTPR